MNLNQKKQLKKIDPLLEKQIKWRFQKDKRTILYITRTKMLIHVSQDQWQQNCAGLLILYQKRFTYGFTILDTINLDINFDFQLYSNFPAYNKYIGDLKCFIFLAPSQKHCLKIMFVMQTKPQLSQLKKQIDKIYGSNKDTDVQLFNRPQVKQLLKLVPIDQNLLNKSETFKEQVEQKIKQYYQKTAPKQQSNKNSGFKFYAMGRQDWNINLKTNQYLVETNKKQIIEQIKKLQKQHAIRSPTKN